jgi:hypothetical protein
MARTAMLTALMVIDLTDGPLAGGVAQCVGTPDVVCRHGITLVNSTHRLQINSSATWMMHAVKLFQPPLRNVSIDLGGGQIRMS